MFWANFLHIYQPPTQTDELVKKITEESYVKIVDGLNNNSKVKITLNISGVLTEFLAKLGYTRLLNAIADLCVKGQIELVDSAKYHPILPLIPENEIIRQIKLNHQTNQKFFGRVYQPNGFFCPEMAYSPLIGKMLESLGYQWVIIDQVASGKNKLAFDRLYKQQDLKDFYLFFRHREASNVLAIGAKTEITLASRLKKNTDSTNLYLITALDGETFGHHNKNYDQVLFSFYRKEESFIPVTISELLILITKVESITPIESSWSSSPYEIRQGVPYGLWDDPSNEIQRTQWELTNYVLDKLHKTDRHHPKYHQARLLLDQALHSDQYWWASCQIIFDKLLTWSEEMIKKGANVFLEVIRVLDNNKGERYKKAQDLYNRIIDEIESEQVKHLVASQKDKIRKKLK